MLSRADYGELWGGRGYPPRPAFAAFVGTVVHRCLELLLTAFHDRGCPSITDPVAVEVIRGLGGYSRLVESVVKEELATLKGNPRAVDLEQDFARQLAKDGPRIRQLVQMAISRAQFVPVGDNSEIGSEGPDGTGITRGSHTEVELRDGDLRVMGRADLITLGESGCTITDYKTGEPSEGHADQIRLYGLLWNRDQRVNPDQIPIASLLVAYATHDESVEVPSEAELATLAAQITSRIEATEEELDLRPPPARPDPEICRFCDVRHLCDDYWTTVPSTLAVGQSESAAGFVDCGGEIAERNGPKSWVLRLDGEPNSALLRTTDERPGFSVGDHVRLLGVVETIEADGTPQLVLTMTQFSESFVLDIH